MVLDEKVAESREKHTATLIFLHGMGEKAEEWIGILQDLVPPHVKVICPQGEIFGDYSKSEVVYKPGWCNVYGSDAASNDKVDVDTSAREVIEIIERESKLVPTERILLGGFSQGAAVIMYTTLTYDKVLGGLISLSQYFLAKTKTIELLKRIKKPRPIPYFACHGISDVMVPYITGQFAFHLFKKYFRPNYFKAISDLGHFVNDEVWNEVRSFIDNHVPPK